jgi:hypothetical protein
LHLSIIPFIFAANDYLMTVADDTLSILIDGVPIRKDAIERVSGHALNNNKATREPHRTHETGAGGRVYIHLHSGKKIPILLMSVSNQASWIANDGNSADVATAIATLNSWLD